MKILLGFSEAYQVMLKDLKWNHAKIQRDHPKPQEHITFCVFLPWKK